MKLANYITCIAALVVSCITPIHGQSADDIKSEQAANKALKEMIEKAYFSDLSIIFTSERQALQQVCNAIGKRQSLVDEKKIIFKIDTPPSFNEPTILSLRQKTGLQIIETLCQNLNLKSRYKNGALHFSTAVNSSQISNNTDFLKNTSLKTVSITSETFPQAVRNLLSKHNMSFSLYAPVKESGIIDISSLNVSIYRDQNTTLLATLTKLAKSVNLKLIVSKNEVLFLSKDKTLQTIIQPNNDL